MAFQNKVVHGETLTRENFTDPPLELGIVPFWFWNGDLEYEQLELQLRQYHDRGVRSLFIHGRMGLNVPYLSDAWFDRVKFAVEKGREIGIDLWIYDEMDWPSGTANRQVIQEDPDLGQRYLELVPLPFEGPIFNFLEAHDDRYVNTGDSNPIAAYGVRRYEYENEIRELVDLNKNLAWEKTIPWEAPPGHWVLLYFLEKRAPYYIDTLNPDSTRKFLDLTHERYKNSVGHEFGKTVPGFFTDEPAMYYYHVGLKNYVVPWSKQMFKIFRERRGYDLKPWLPALYTNMGEQTVRVRYDFWRTLTEQYRDTYYKQIRDWCEDNGVIFTGHMLFEEHLRLAARCEGNLFKYLEQLHLIGVDHLYPKIGTPEEPEQHVALKLGSSAAHHFGSTRLLCESMGGTYWNCTLERMKWINNWEYVLGVNLFNNHGYHYTIEGERKRDWPPSQFYQHTWWPYYDRFTHYNARLSHLLSGGRHVARALILYPINSIWTNYVPHKTDPVGDLIELDFSYLTDTLLRLHYDYDYVDEDVLAGADVDDGKISIADETYDVLILPPVTHIKESTYRSIQKFVQGGGRVIADTLVPVAFLESGTNGDVSNTEVFFGWNGHNLLKTFLADGQVEFHVEKRGNVYLLCGKGMYSKRVLLKRLIEVGGVASDEIAAFMASAGSFGVQYQEASSNEEKERILKEYLGILDSEEKHRKNILRTVLNDCVTPDVTISDEEVFYLHRVKDGFDLYFFVNTRQEDRGRVTITFEKVARPELWNTTTGTTKPLPVYRIENGRLTIELDFPPGESHVVVLTGDADAPHVTSTNLHVETFDGERVVGFATSEIKKPYAEIVVDGLTRRLESEGRTSLPALDFPQTYDFTVEHDNVLVIDRWKMKVGSDDSEEDAYLQPGFDDSEWLDVTHGAWEMQLPQERDEAEYPVELWYRTWFEVSALPSDLRLMIDGFSGSGYDLFINGRKVEDRGRQSRLDAEILEVNILPYVHEGRNLVVVKLTARRRTDGMLDLLKIVGDFGLEENNENYVIAPKNQRLHAGDWTRQGYPFFSGTGIYTVEIDIPAAYLDGGRLIFEAECGEDVLDVRVNGSEARVAPWHPYRLDVTDLVREGKNTFEIRVTNTLINILEGIPQRSGLFHPPRLVHQARYELNV